LYAWGGIALTGVVVSLLNPTFFVGSLLLNLALLELFVFLSTILHECGHILAARIAGLRVFGIEIGFGRYVADFWLGGLRWQFRALPFGGFAYAAPRTTAYYRLRNSVFILGGPLVNLMLVALSIGSTFDGEKRLYEALSQGLSPVAVLFFANAGLLLYSVCPAEFTTARGKIANDALLLWRTWRTSKSEIEKASLVWHYWEAEHCRSQRKFSEAETWIANGLEQYPNNFVLESQRALLLDAKGEFLAGFELSEKLLARSNEFPTYEPILLNNVAYFGVCTRNPHLLERADVTSREALDRMPWLACIKGTRGAVLLRLGRCDEALKLLREAFTAHDDRISRALSACWLAEAYLRMDEPTQAKRYLAVARRADPHCVLLSDFKVSGHAAMVPQSLNETPR
jgi:tetratricopeptide (TPR) repeat protein